MQQRLAGFKQATQGKKVKTHIFESPFQFLEAEKIAYEALQANPTIDAVFASSDLIAIGVLKAAHKLGRHIPQDLQVVGFDGIALSEMVTPSLTTVAQNLYELGETATNMLIQQIKGAPLEQEHVTIAPSFIVRQTTKE